MVGFDATKANVYLQVFYVSERMMFIDGLGSLRHIHVIWILILHRLPRIDTPMKATELYAGGGTAGSFLPLLFVSPLFFFPLHPLSSFVFLFLCSCLFTRSQFDLKLMSACHILFE